MCQGALGKLDDSFNRVKWIHDRVLRKLYHGVKSCAEELGFKECYVDLSGDPDEYKEFPVNLLISEQRPDMCDFCESRSPSSCSC